MNDSRKPKSGQRQQPGRETDVHALPSSEGPSARETLSDVGETVSPERETTYQRFEAAPQTCITGGSTSHKPTASNASEGPENPLSTGGLDWLNLAVFGYWHPERWHDTRRRLLEAKEAAQSDPAGVPVPISSEQGDRLHVGPGSAHKGIQCKFVVWWQGNRICIVDRGSPSETHAAVFVEFHSAYLMAYGHEAAYANVRELLAAFGFMWDYDCVSRVDVCVDLVDVSPADFFADDKRRIGRARQDKVYRDNGEVFAWYIGADGAPLVCRIYDKPREILKDQDPTKLQLLIDNRWGEVPNQATRIEFQLRTDALRELGIRSFADLCDNLEKLVNYLVYEWVRFADRDIDKRNNHRDRCGVSALWQNVQAAFVAWAGEHKGMPPKRRKNLGQACVKQLFQQAQGCLAKLAAMSGQTLDSAASAWKWANEQLPDVSKAFPERVGEKLLGLQRAGPGVYIDEREIPF